ncbi:PspC domain-containing protein [Pseudonocardia kunmingensis]|uniref:Phage shock protein C (PspC) family protein n=1 Tax=Pseudonocardia kunmingensis TaxID=630975 RepID=A0A543E178_9PSEU|nr:PspC domain-containing protein [Pseudonocardia kunmingensis]TQM15348.1 phage shock protein C (PspC) family protein [Pseudonocardia kunmingensis]
MTRTDVQDTLREMWETRPARPRDDRQIAGVAAGIARRYDIDPVLVRVGFVVAAFSGIGAALYIAGWILLPDAPADPSAPARSRTRGYLVVGLAIAAAITVGSLFGGNGPDVLLPLLVVAGLLYLLHRSRGKLGTGATASEAPTVATPAAAGGPSLVKDPAGPPAWDPLGAAPFAWDLPEPSPAPAPPPPRTLPVTSVTLGLALIAGAATSVIMLLAGALTVANLPVLLGVVLAVLGAGLVVGSFLRAGRGLIPFALLLSVLTWSVVAAPLDRWQGNGWGELRAAPTTVAALQTTYQRTAGEIDLDLRNLDLGVGPDGNTNAVRTRISLGAGDVLVQVPNTADVTLTGSLGVGDISFGEQRDDGPGAELNVVDDLGTDGVRSGRPLLLDIEAGAGDVEVRRG